MDVVEVGKRVGVGVWVDSRERARVMIMGLTFLRGGGLGWGGGTWEGFWGSSGIGSTMGVLS